jgi:PAS domain S-box-containing protein
MSGSVQRLLSRDRRVRLRSTLAVAFMGLVGFWLLDSVVDWLLDGRTRSLVEEIVSPNLRELWVRLLVAYCVSLLWRAHLARRRAHLLWSALDAAPDGVQITDTSGLIAYSNASVERIYGYSAVELEGHHVNEMNADPQFASRVILPAIREAGTWHGELDVRHKDGHVFPIWLTTSVVRAPHGAPIAAIGVIRDISERKKDERELWEYARRLEEATGLKDLFADILRHDLLGPAATIQLSVESLLRRDPDPAATRRILETARRSCAKLIEIVDGAAKYAKLSTAQGIEFRELDLATVLREVVDEFDARAKERGLTVLVDTPGPFLARANPMIADVFENFLSNAAKYGPERGTVWVRVDDDGASWRVSVTDSGEGIPDADKQKVFLRFERLRKEGVKGTGLGLAIAHRIVVLHGGRIWVEDAPARGARFCVTIPKSRPAAAPSAPSTPGGQPRGSAPSA